MANHWILFRHYIIIWETISPKIFKQWKIAFFSNSKTTTTNWSPRLIESNELVLFRVCMMNHNDDPIRYDKWNKIVLNYCAFQVFFSTAKINHWHTCTGKNLHSHVTCSAGAAATVNDFTQCHNSWLLTETDDVVFSVHTSVRFNSNSKYDWNGIWRAQWCCEFTTHATCVRAISVVFLSNFQNTNVRTQ